MYSKADIIRTLFDLIGADYLYHASIMPLLKIRLIRKHKCIGTLLLGIALIFWLSASANAANQLTIQSPDGLVNFTIDAEKGQLYYTISSHNKAVIEPSLMSMIMDGVQLSSGIALGKVELYEINEKYVTRGVHTEALNHCNGAIFPVRHIKSNTSYKLEARVFNDGVGFRFIIPGEGLTRIPDETTSFILPTGSTVWYHGFYWHYEGMHAKKTIADIQAGEWAAPPITFKLPKGAGYASISEAALMDYPGMSLQADGNHGFVSRLGHITPNAYPFAHDYKIEDAKRLAIPAAIEGTITTPWRTVMIGSDLNALVNNDLISNLAPAPDKSIFPEGVNTKWIQPGRSVWTWLDGGERTLEGMKEFSRLAGQLGFEYNTVDAFWAVGQMSNSGNW